MLREMVSFYNTDKLPKDLRPTRIERDEKEIDSSEEVFISIRKNLFFTDALVIISTGATPLADINKNLISAQQKDKVAYIGHIEERLSQSNPNNVSAPIRRMYFKTFPPINKKINCTDNKNITFKTDPNWLGK